MELLDRMQRKAVKEAIIEMEKLHMDFESIQKLTTVYNIYNV